MSNVSSKFQWYGTTFSMQSQANTTTTRNDASPVCYILDSFYQLYPFCAPTYTCKVLVWHGFYNEFKTIITILSERLRHGGRQTAYRTVIHSPAAPPHMRQRKQVPVVSPASPPPAIAPPLRTAVMWRGGCDCRYLSPCRWRIPFPPSGAMPEL